MYPLGRFQGEVFLRGNIFLYRVLDMLDISARWLA